MTIFVLLLNRVFVHLFWKASKIATSMECYKKNDLLTPKEQQKCWDTLQRLRNISPLILSQTMLIFLIDDIVTYSLHSNYM